MTVLCPVCYGTTTVRKVLVPEPRSGSRWEAPPTTRTLVYHVPRYREIAVCEEHGPVDQNQGHPRPGEM